MKILSVRSLALLSATLLLSVACTQAPPPAPTAAPAAPAKPAEPTKPAAQAPAAPTAAPAQPTAAAAKKPAYPEKGRAITVIIPWPTGGSTDIGARVLAPPMEKALGTPITLVNKGGASSQVGVTDMALSKPDGYTLAWTNLPSSMTPYLDPSRQAQYKRKDLVQVANVVADPEVFAVKPDSPYKTLKDLFDAAKAKPDTIKISITGIGSDNHLALLMLEEMTGAKFNIVNFDGGGPATTALLGGHVDASIQTLGNYPSEVKNNSLRLLGIMDDQRNRLAPNIPTLKEMGYNLSYASSRGISVPAGTPKEIVDTLSNAVKTAMADPEVQKKNDEMLLTTRFMDAAQYTAYWDNFEKQVNPIVDKYLVQPQKKK